MLVNLRQTTEHGEVRLLPVRHVQSHQPHARRRRNAARGFARRLHRLQSHPQDAHGRRRVRRRKQEGCGGRTHTYHERPQPGKLVRLDRHAVGEARQYDMGIGAGRRRESEGERHLRKGGTINPSPPILINSDVPTASSFAFSSSQEEHNHAVDPIWGSLDPSSWARLSDAGIVGLYIIPTEVYLFTSLSNRFVYS